jgi:hypothetical protein
MIRTSPAYASVMLIILDFVLLNGSILGTHWLKYHNCSLSPIHTKVMLIYWASWLLTSLVWKKIAIMRNGQFRDWLGIVTKSSAGLSILVSVVIVGCRMTSASPIQAYLPCLVFYSAEVVLCIIYGRIFCHKSPPHRPVGYGNRQRYDLATAVLTVSWLLLLASLSLVWYVKHPYQFELPEYVDYAVMLNCLWIVSSAITNKYSRSNFNEVNVWLPASMKSAMLMLGGIAMLLYGTRLFHFTRLLVFGPIITYFALESVMFYLYHLYLRYEGNVRDLEDIREFGRLPGANANGLAGNHEDFPGLVQDPVEMKLKMALEFMNSKLYEFDEAYGIHYVCLRYFNAAGADPESEIGE